MTRIELLREVAAAIKLLYPIVYTINPRERLIELATQKTDKEINILAHELVHTITVLNQSFRVRKGVKTLKSSREDNLNALSLLVEKINPEILKYKGVKRSYRCIRDNYAGKSFTQKELREQNGYGKTSTGYHINKLLEYDIIKITRGYKNRGYWYRLK